MDPDTHETNHVTYLRAMANDPPGVHNRPRIHEAADYIEHLEAQIKQLGAYIMENHCFRADETTAEGMARLDPLAVAPGGPGCTNPAGEGAVDAAIRLLQLAAGRNAFKPANPNPEQTIADNRALQEFLLAAFRPGEVDDDAVFVPNLRHRDRPTLAAEALTRLKLAHSRGAFLPALEPNYAAVRTAHEVEGDTDVESLRRKLAGARQEREVLRCALAGRRSAPHPDTAKAWALWQLLDDVDTADDIAKENDKHFRELAMQAAAKRNKYFVSEDGQTLVPPRGESTRSWHPSVIAYRLTRAANAYGKPITRPEDIHEIVKLAFGDGQLVTQTSDLRGEDPDRAMRAFIEPLERVARASAELRDEAEKLPGAELSAPTGIVWKAVNDMLAEQGLRAHVREPGDVLITTPRVYSTGAADNIVTVVAGLARIAAS